MLVCGDTSAGWHEKGAQKGWQVHLPLRLGPLPDPTRILTFAILQLGDLLRRRVLHLDDMLQVVDQDDAGEVGGPDVPLGGGQDLGLQQVVHLLLDLLPQLAIWKAEWFGLMASFLAFLL